MTVSINRHKGNKLFEYPVAFTINNGFINEKTCLFTLDDFSDLATLSEIEMAAPDTMR